MEDEREDQPDPQDPEEAALRQDWHQDVAEVVAVIVEVGFALVDVQVAKHVHEHKAKQDDARHRHHGFLADRGGVEIEEPEAVAGPPSRGVPARLPRRMIVSAPSISPDGIAASGARISAPVARFENVAAPAFFRAYPNPTCQFKSQSMERHRFGYRRCSTYRLIRRLQRRIPITDLASQISPALDGRQCLLYRAALDFDVFVLVAGQHARLELRADEEVDVLRSCSPGAT